MPTKSSEAKAKVTLDSTSFEKQSKAVISAANTMSSAVTAAFAAAGIAMLAVFGAQGVSAIGHSIKDVLDLGEEMANAGHAAQMAAGQFYLFHNAVEKGITRNTAVKLIGENAEALNRSASVFRDVSIKLWAVGEKIRGFWIGLMERVSPVLSRILDGALGLSLLQAGQWFGDKISDAVKVVYQLAQDGQLWNSFKQGFQLAFDYAGERMIWLGKVGYDILSVVFSDATRVGIVEGIAGAWDHVTPLGEHFADVMGNAIFDFITDIRSIVGDIEDVIESLLNKLGAVSDAELSKSRQSRGNDLHIRRMVAQKPDAPDITKERDGFFERIKDVFAKDQFNPSNNLAKEIESFSNVIAQALTKYTIGEDENPTMQIENNTRRQASGVDSLAAIGGGGNVYLGLSVLDVNRAQLRELQDINRKLGGNSNLPPNLYLPNAADSDAFTRNTVSGFA